MAWSKDNPKRRYGRVGSKLQGFGMRTLGVRGGVLRAEGADATISLHENAEALLRDGLWSAKYRDEMWIGYDGRELSYNLSLTGSLGVMFPVGPGHGPVLRALLHGELFELGGFHLAQLALPGAELGYSFSKGVVQAELTGILAPSLLGELLTPELQAPAHQTPAHQTQARRWDLTGVFWGGTLTLRWQDLSLSLSATTTERIRADMAPTAARDRSVRVLSQLCGLLGKKRPKPQRTTRGGAIFARSGPAASDYGAAICADFTSTAVWLESASNDPLASLTSVGFSFRVGRISRLDTSE